MVGALNKLPIAIAGMLFFSDPVTPTGVMGVFLGKVFLFQMTHELFLYSCHKIAFFAGILYSYAKSQKASPALPVYAKVDMVDLDDAKENRP